MEFVLGACGSYGGELRGVNLTTIDGSAAREIVGAVHQHTLVAFRNQQMTIQEYSAMGRKLGTLMPYPDRRYRHPEHEEVFVSSNVKGRKMGMARSGYFWHTDLQFMKKPQALTVLYPQLLPDATRETLFINMADVYSELPAHLRKVVDGRTASHDPVLRYKVEHADVDANLDLGELIEKGRRSFPAPEHPCVITHPVTGRRILYMSDGFTTSINGLPHEESQAALKEIFDFVRRPERVISYTWELGAVIIWDNRTLIHKAGVTVGEATLFRLGIDDMVPFYEGIAC